MPSSTERVTALVDRALRAQSDVQEMMRGRRLLVSRSAASQQDRNVTGTVIPSPFDRTELAIPTMIAEPAMGAQYFKSRITANRPEVKVIPRTARADVSVTVSKRAGEQERMDAELLDAAGLKEAQEQCGYGMTLGGVSYLLVLPREADWGLPDRAYYTDLTDEEVDRLKREGQIVPLRTLTPSGKWGYAERADVWAKRRKAKAEERAINGSGASLFTLRAFPRDMCVSESDGESSRLGEKWWAAIEEVPSDSVAPGTEIARAAARKNGVPADDLDLYGFFKDEKGHIQGGISRGVPLNSGWSRPDMFTLIRYFDRHEQVIMVAPQGGVQGAYEVWRAPHGCMVMGQPANPAQAVPFFRADVATPRQAFSTPMDQVYAYASPINQLLTLRSNATAFNLIPRWVTKQQRNGASSSGQILREEDGEPTTLAVSQTPGLNPNEIAAYPEDVTQLIIKTEDSDNLLALLFEQMRAAMPSGPATGASGESTAWGTQIAVQQQQATLKEPVDNFAAAIKGVVWRMHGWLRQMDVPIQFYAAPRERRDADSSRALIEFNPRDITDSITVVQDIDTPDERTARIQIGMELWLQGAITDEEFYEDYMRSQDARQAVIDRYVQMAVDYAMYGKVPATAQPQLWPESLIVQIANGIRGDVHYELLDTSPNYALANARAQAGMANQNMAMQDAMSQGLMPPTQGVGGEISEAAGISRPGMGMASTLAGQLGSGAPGAGEFMPPVAV